MNKKFLIAILFASLLNANCKKENDVDTIDVSKITVRDALGNSIGESDDTDWASDSNWTSAENGLFETPSPDQLLNTKKSNGLSVFGYPNPISSVLAFYADVQDSTLVEFVTTDNRLSIKERHYVKMSSNARIVQLLFDTTKYSDNTNYRLYYGFYSAADGLYYKGHGDVSIKR